MSGFLDTSVIVRYLVGDSPELAEKAAEVIDREEHLQLTDVVIVETSYVLTGVYHIPRVQVVDALITFIQKENIELFAIEKEKVLQALILCRPSGRVSFADAMIWAAARSAGGNIVYSLDQRFPKDGLQIKP